MELDKQVVNLELSKKLKSLNVKQESLLSWIQLTNGEYVASSYHGCRCWTKARGIVDYYKHEDYSAFTASELLEILPDYLDNSGCLKIEKHDVNGEGITYFIEYGYGYHEHQDKNLSNALAKTIIALIENKLIEV